MRFTILMRVDDVGSWPVLLEGDEVPEGGAESRWRYVATVDDRAVALRLVELVRDKCIEESRRAREGRLQEARSLKAS
jgi:hypothetical protein